ncbi:MAG: protein phosphatase CheZ [Alphaproteobacteria bacterium]
MNESVQSQDEHHSYERDQVVKIINSVIEKVEHQNDDGTIAIFQELQELQKIIDDARKELGSTRPSEINDTHIPTATDELDAVVAATAEATGTIMDSCDVIQEKASALTGDEVNDIVNETMKIFEACSFQDITGQRITKVVTTLKDIEAKVSKLMQIIGDKLPGIDEGEDGGETEKADSGVITDEDLLNGPQLPGNAISQDDIDALLADFD